MTASRIERELAQVFLKLGIIGFGGPAAHLALMESEIVQKRNWISRSELLDYLSASNLIPGPNSTEVAIHIGYKMAGFRGLIIAGCCFILPAALIVGLIAWAYVSYGSLPQAQAILSGIKPVIIAVIIQALWNLGRSSLKNPVLIGLGCLAMFALFMGLHEVIVIFASGCLAWFLQRPQTGRHALFAFPPLSAVAFVTQPITSSSLFLFFLKVGSVLFGSGYVLVGFLRADLVERWHWLTEAQLLDAIAVGQFTPGPVFTTATFIGYILAGSKGAALATLGIFLPAFVFVALTAPFLVRIRNSPDARTVLDGLNVASLAVMAIAAAFLARHSLINIPAVVLCLVSLALLIRFKINSAWLVLMGALIGLFVKI